MTIQEMQIVIDNLQVQMRDHNNHMKSSELVDGDILIVVFKDLVKVEWNGGIGLSDNYEEALNYASSDSWRRIQNIQNI